MNANPAPYPPIEPYDRGFIEAGSGHRIHWETCGNPLGSPALFVHGGPGGGCSPNDRRLFDPARYRIVLFDQRGCGRSLPHAGTAGGLRDNTTALLLDDVEAIREALGIERWLILGGSWGATLALAYAQARPERVRALVLRGVFTARRSELDWLYRAGASFLHPEAWERFLAPIPMGDRGDLVAAYHARLLCGDAALEAEAARAWCAWEDTLVSLLPGANPRASDDASLLARARLETHYFVNQAFLAEGQILANAQRLAGIPGTIVQGRCDCVTPPVTAWELHRAWKGSRLEIVPDACHASSEPGILRALLAATAHFAA